MLSLLKASAGSTKGCETEVKDTSLKPAVVCLVPAAWVYVSFLSKGGCAYETATGCSCGGFNGPFGIRGRPGRCSDGLVLSIVVVVLWCCFGAWRWSGVGIRLLTDHLEVLGGHPATKIQISIALPPITNTRYRVGCEGK